MVYTLSVLAALCLATWANCFGLLVRTPYPDIEPVGPSYHSETCQSTKLASSVTSPPSSTEDRMAMESIPGDSDSCWTEYVKRYNTTDLDRLLIEEQAKVC